MNRITHDCQQGSQAWLDLRAKYFTASELAAAAGESKHKKRSTLLKEKATGIATEHDDETKARFERGHKAEAMARPIVEQILGAQLYPVTMSVEVDGLPLLASLDGIDILGDVIWENKLRSESLVQQVNAGCLEPHYTWQIEQQLFVSGAGRCYFTTSDGTPEGTFGLWYESNPEIRAKIVSIWKQFAKDLAEYQHVEAVAKPAAEKVEGLPALFVQVEGRVVASNMDAFKGAADLFLSRLPKADQLKGDQDFANADQAAKDCKDAEDRLQVVKAQAQSQATSIDEVFRAIDSISEKIRTARLSLERVVKAEKENRKNEIVSAASKAMFDHTVALQERVGVQFKPEVTSFADSIKGLKSLDSMRDKVSVALANAKIEANAVADRIEFNQKQMQAQSAAGLFIHDFIQVCTKAPDDFAAIVAMRVAAKKEADEKLLAEQREKIRTEEEARAASRIAPVTAKNEETIAITVTGVMQTTGGESTAIAVAHIPTDQAIDTGKTIKLGEINAMLAPVSISADGLASLGILPVAREKNAKLYDANKFQTICRLISEHVMAQAFKKAA